MSTVDDFPAGTKVWFKWGKSQFWPAKVSWPAVLAGCGIDGQASAVGCMRSFPTVKSPVHPSPLPSCVMLWQVIEPFGNFAAKPHAKKPILVYFYRKREG